MLKKINIRTILHISACLLSIILLLSPIKAYASEYEAEDDYDIIVVYDTNQTPSE